MEFFGNDFAWDIVISDVNNSSLSHADNHKKSFFSVLSEGQTDDINCSSVTVEEKTLILISFKQRKNFAWACILMVIIVICLLTERKSISLK